MMKDYFTPEFVLLAVVCIAGVTAVCFALVAAIRALCKTKKEYSPGSRIAWSVISLLCVAIVVLSFMSNIGWARLIIATFVIPLLQPLFLLVVTVVTSAYNKFSAGLTVVTVCSHVFFVGSNLLLPDAGEIGGEYMFFGLIEYMGDDRWYAVAVLMGVASILFTIVQLSIGLSVRTINENDPSVAAYYVKEYVRRRKNEMTLTQEENSSIVGGE